MWQTLIFLWQSVSSKIAHLSCVCQFVWMWYVIFCLLYSFPPQKGRLCDHQENIVEMMLGVALTFDHEWLSHLHLPILTCCCQSSFHRVQIWLLNWVKIMNVRTNKYMHSNYNKQIKYCLKILIWVMLYHQ